MALCALIQPSTTSLALVSTPGHVAAEGPRLAGILDALLGEEPSEPVCVVMLFLAASSAKTLAARVSCAFRGVRGMPFAFGVDNELQDLAGRGLQARGTAAGTVAVAAAPARPPGRTSRGAAHAATQTRRIRLLLVRTGFPFVRGGRHPRHRVRRDARNVTAPSPPLATQPAASFARSGEGHDNASSYNIHTKPHHAGPRLGRPPGDAGGPTRLRRPCVEKPRGDRVCVTDAGTAAAVATPIEGLPVDRPVRAGSPWYFDRGTGRGPMSVSVGWTS